VRFVVVVVSLGQLHKLCFLFNIVFVIVVIYNLSVGTTESCEYIETMSKNKLNLVLPPVNTEATVAAATVAPTPPFKTPSGTE